MGKKILWFGKRSTLNIRAGFLTSRSHPRPLGRDCMCAFSFNICLFFIISYLFTNKRHLLLDILSEKTFCNARVRSKATVTWGPLASWNRCINGYQLSWVVAELSFCNLKFLEDPPSWKCLVTIEKLVLRIFASLWECLRIGKRERLKSQSLFQDSVSLGSPKNQSFCCKKKPGQQLSPSSLFSIVGVGLQKMYLWTGGSSVWWLYFMGRKSVNPCLCAHTIHFFVPGTVLDVLKAFPVYTDHLNYAGVKNHGSILFCLKLFREEFISFFTRDKEKRYFFKQKFYHNSSELSI